jgi:hypothetical protein
VNDGVLPQGKLPASLPGALLGSPDPVPMPDDYWHYEAADWRRRVRENGGTVSRQTMAAVSRLCVAIESAGIRDRFYRVNLFCGNSDASLAAVRTPLFRGPSLTGTQYGNATDTNVNFVAGDYAETGASGGLTANGSKWLATGVSPANMPSVATGHLAAYSRPAVIGPGVRYFLGTYDNASNIYGIRAIEDAGNRSVQGFWSAFAGASVVTGSPQPGGFWLTNRASSTLLTLSRNANIVATTTAPVTPAVFSQDFYVFALGQNNTGTGRLNHTLRGYSIGAAMTDTQTLAYNTAMQTFQTALGRQA